jgi:hypothetical protein
MYITRIPALYASKLLSAEFWDDPTIPQKSANYFHLTPLFNSDTEYPGRREGIPYTLATLTETLPAQPQPGETELIAAWKERHLDWGQRRAGWYDSARSEWELTPVR